MIWRAVLMKKEEIQRKIKFWAYFLIILILFPYVMTVFIHGADMKTKWNQNQNFVKVKQADIKGEEEIIEVPWNEYFTGVLSAEVPVSAEREFIKAQAVVVRTKLYQINEDARQNGREAVFEEQYLTTKEIEKKQMNAQNDSYYERLIQAEEETKKQVLYYQGTYAYVPFHRSSNGMTRSYQEVTGQEAYPYLTAKECPEDKEAEDELQVRTISYREVQKKCQPFLKAVEEKDADKLYKFSDFKIEAYDSAGYVLQMKIGNTICSGEQFREALSLPSSSFSIKDVKGELQIKTSGNGHGLGMSQWTANQMAKEGKSYREILQYFYEGTEVVEQTME